MKFLDKNDCYAKQFLSIGLYSLVQQQRNWHCLSYLHIFKTSNIHFHLVLYVSRYWSIQGFMWLLWIFLQNRISLECLGYCLFHTLLKQCFAGDYCDTKFVFTYTEVFWTVSFKVIKSNRTIWMECLCHLPSENNHTHTHSTNNRFLSWSLYEISTYTKYFTKCVLRMYKSLLLLVITTSVLKITDRCKCSSSISEL